MVWAVSLSTAELISRGLTPAHHLSGILSLIEFGTLVGALAQSVLYLRHLRCEASPKAISGRTSYFQV